jgi:hypothetical protein
VQYAFRQHGPEIGSVWNVSGASVNTSTGGDVPLAIKLYGASSTSGSGKLKLEVARPSLEQQGGRGGTIVHDDLRPVLGDLELELQVVRASVNSAGWRPDRPSNHARQLVLDVVVTKSNDPNCPRLERGDILLYDQWHPVRTSDGKSTLWPGDEVDMMVCDQRHAHAWEDLSQWDSTHQSYIGVTIKGPWYLWP